MAAGRCYTYGDSMQEWIAASRSLRTSSSSLVAGSGMNVMAIAGGSPSAPSLSGVVDMLVRHAVSGSGRTTGSACARSSQHRRGGHVYFNGGAMPLVSSRKVRQSWSARITTSSLLPACTNARPDMEAEHMQARGRERTHHLASAPQRKVDWGETGIGAIAGTLGAEHSRFGKAVTRASHHYSLQHTLHTPTLLSLNRIAPHSRGARPQMVGTAGTSQCSYVTAVQRSSGPDQGIPMAAC